MKFSRILEAFSLIAVLSAGIFGCSKEDKTINQTQKISEPKFQFDKAVNSIEVEGVILKLRKGVTTDDASEEVIFIKESPDKVHAVVLRGSHQDTDFWLIDRKTRHAETIDEKVGRNVGVEWLSDDIFLVRWGGMGYSFTIFRKISAPQKRAKYHDVIGFNLEKNIVVSLKNVSGFPDSIAVTHGIFDNSQSKETKIPAGFSARKDWSMDENVEFKNDKIKVTFESGESMEVN